MNRQEENSNTHLQVYVYFENRTKKNFVILPNNSQLLVCVEARLYANMVSCILCTSINSSYIVYANVIHECVHT